MKNKYIKSVKDGYIVAVCEVVSAQETSLEIDEAEYKDIILRLERKPSDPDGYFYKLRSDTLEWELCPMPTPSEPPEEDISDAEALKIITGGASNETL